VGEETRETEATRGLTLLPDPKDRRRPAHSSSLQQALSEEPALVFLAALSMLVYLWRVI